MAEEIQRWLETIRLGQYAQNFIDGGYDDPDTLSAIDDGDLDVMGITLPGHRKRLLLNAAKYVPPSSDAAVTPAAAPAAVAPVVPAKPADASGPPLPVRAPDDAPPSRPAPVAVAAPKVPPVVPTKVPVAAPKPPVPADPAPPLPATIELPPPPSTLPNPPSALPDPPADEPPAVPTSARPKLPPTPESMADKPLPPLPGQPSDLPPPPTHTPEPPKQPESNSPTKSKAPPPVKRRSVAPVEAPKVVEKTPAAAVPAGPPKLPERIGDKQPPAVVMRGPPKLPQKLPPSNNDDAAKKPAPRVAPKRRPVSAAIGNLASPLNAMLAAGPQAVVATSNEEAAISNGTATTKVIVQNASGSLYKDVEVFLPATVKNVIDAYVAVLEEPIPSENAIELWEVHEDPPIMRPLAQFEDINEVMKLWPKDSGIPSRFMLNVYPPGQTPQPNSSLVGNLDKRGGSHKTWKSRHFLLQDKGLAYFKAPPTTQKQFSNPLGCWLYSDATIYAVRNLKKAPRPELCFCIKPNSTPMWPENIDERHDVFENGCKFMCAETELERNSWIASIRLGQSRLKVSTPSTKQTPQQPQINHEHSEDEEEDEPKPEEFVPIKPRAVRGVGLGGVTKSIRVKKEDS